MASQGRLAQIYNHMKRTYAKQQAYIDMGMGATLNSIMMTMMKLLVTTHGVPTTSVVFIRMAFTTIATAATLLIIHKDNLSDAFLSHKGSRIWLILRGLTGIASFWFLYAALEYLAMEDQQAIWYTCPFMTGLIAFLWLGDAYRTLEVACGAVCMLGVLLVIQPAALTGVKTTSSKSYNKAMGFTFAFVGTFLGALALVIVRRMGSKVSILTSLFYFGWISAFVMGLVMLVDETQRFPLQTLAASGVLLLTGVADNWLAKHRLPKVAITGALATYLMNRAVQTRRPGRVTLIMYIQLPLILLLDYVVFDHATNALSLAGCLVIIAAASTIAAKKDGGEGEEGDSEKLGEDAGGEALYELVLSTATVASFPKEIEPA